MKRFLRPTPLVTATVLLANLSFAAALAGEPSEYTWDGALARNAVVEIINPNGDVFVQRSDSGRVEVHALRNASAGDPSAVEIRTQRTERGYAICSEAPGALFDCVAGARGPASSVYRVDELVAVPPGTTVIVRGQNGKIVIEDGDNGTTANGAVQALVGGGGASKTLVFTARDGAVTTT